MHEIEMGQIDVDGIVRNVLAERIAAQAREVYDAHRRAREARDLVEQCKPVTSMYESSMRDDEVPAYVKALRDERDGLKVRVRALEAAAAVVDPEPSPEMAKLGEVERAFNELRARILMRRDVSNLLAYVAGVEKALGQR